MPFFIACQKRKKPGESPAYSEGTTPRDYVGGHNRWGQPNPRFATLWRSRKTLNSVSPCAELMVVLSHSEIVPQEFFSESSTNWLKTDTN